MMEDGDYADAAKTHAIATGLNPDDERLPALIKKAEDRMKAQALQAQGEHECGAGDFDAAVKSFEEIKAGATRRPARPRHLSSS
eukprot:SAG11_NODE_121_length_15851_cov_6.082466_16_plen_84_part_00